VSFTGPDGTPLAGTFVAPRNGAAVVLAHGLDADRTQLLAEAQLLVGHGYGVLLFDGRAHGASGGSMSTWGYLESGDVERGVDLVQQRTQLPAGRIGLLGFSIGGTAVVRAAIGDPRVGAVIVEADFGSVADEFRYMFQRYGPLSQLPALWAIQASGLDLAALEPDRMLCSLPPRSLLLIYGTEDPSVPPSQARRMARAACSPSSLLMIDTAEHGGFIRRAPVQYSEQLISFLNSSLLPDGSR
jgi:dipeptidyl aminopeptidase/acylaminoacyl peptidase